MWRIAKRIEILENIVGDPDCPVMARIFCGQMLAPILNGERLYIDRKFGLECCRDQQDKNDLKIVSNHLVKCETAV